jgi:chromosome partitioning protein
VLPAIKTVDKMKVLTVTQRKGGVGKTMASLHLAVQAEMSGSGPVGLIDLDPSRSLTFWFRARKASVPVLIEAKPDLQRAIDALRKHNFQMVIIDTANSVGPDVQEAVSVADLILVPTQPSPPDLRAVGMTVQLIEATRKPLVFLINRVKPRVKLTGEAARNLSQYGTVAPVDWFDRVDYGASQIDGRTIMEMDPKGAGAREVEALWTYLRRRMEQYG